MAPADRAKDAEIGAQDKTWVNEVLFLRLRPEWDELEDQFGSLHVLVPEPFQVCLGPGR